jgi:hypothetical protein
MTAVIDFRGMFPLFFFFPFFFPIF